jgi:hypothetical protein
VAIEKVTNSVGISFGIDGEFSHGIMAPSVENSTGTAENASGGHGILAERMVVNSIGISAGLTGIKCENGNVDASQGTCTGTTSINSHGIHATLVTDSKGKSSKANGIFATVVRGSHGFAETGADNGIWGVQVLHSFGGRASAEAGHYGIAAVRAVGSFAEQGESISQKYDMP